MKKINLLLLLFSAAVFAQPAKESQLFSDTSLYFINSMQTTLSQDELAEMESLLVKAVEEFNFREQYTGDSLHPKKKKRRYRGFEIDLSIYVFRLTAWMNQQGQKIVEISGSCLGWHSIRQGKKSSLDKDWKKKFSDGGAMADGGSCFIYLTVNLELKTHNGLTMNGTA